MLNFSIITVVYNAVDTVGCAIESVLSQQYPNLEYIIIDGASSDGTVEKVQEYASSVSRVVSEPDNGLYDALNKGIDMASGDVIGFLHADDWYVHGEVIGNVARMMEEEKSDALYADLQYVKQKDTSKVLRHWRAGEFSRNNFLSGWMPPHPTFFVRTEKYRDYGGFDLDFTSAADYELMLRFLFRYEISCSYLPDVIVRMRSGGTSNKSIANRLKANQEDYRAWKKNDLNPRFYTRFMKPVSKIPQLFLQS